jgi:type VI secretion system protein ImpM
MINANSVGLFGKLPAHGDFIYRNLPSNFINAWDAWLQGFVGSSQEQIGESWLDVYLTSPIWRFVLSDGVID